MTVANNQPIELVLTNTTERIDIFVVDANCNAIDATALSLKVYDQGETLILQDDYFAGYGDPATLPTRIVKPASTTGQYYFPFGDTSFDALNTTAEPGEFLFVWKVTGAVGSEPVNIVQVVKVVSPRTMRLVPKLRLIVDKAAKQIDDDPEDPMFLGYTDSMLVQFLEGGLGWINAFQPYPMWGSIEDFPDVHTRVLLDAAVVDALTSQELFAVDTDLNYGDQGNSFVIDHQPKLSAILNATWTRLTQVVPPMKRHYVRSGSVRVEAGPAFRFQHLLEASPKGALFRNLFVM